MNKKCISRKCFREINPKTFPGVYWGKRGDYDLNVGCCVHCERENNKSQGGTNEHDRARKNEIQLDESKAVNDSAE